MVISAEIKKVTDPIYQKISSTVPEIEWATYAPYIYKINKLKKEKKERLYNRLVQVCGINKQIFKTKAKLIKQGRSVARCP